MEKTTIFHCFAKQVCLQSSSFFLRSNLRRVGTTSSLVLFEKIILFQSAGWNTEQSLHHCFLLRILPFDNSSFLAAVFENNSAERKIRLTLHGDSFLLMLHFLYSAERYQNGSFNEPQHNMRFSEMVIGYGLPGLRVFMLPVSLNFIRSLCTAD